MLIERKYYKKFDPCAKELPCPEPKENVPCKSCETSAETCSNGKNFALKADDIILLALIVVLLMEEEKDYITIGILAAVFLSEYLF